MQLVFIPFVHRRRPRADKAHIALEHVEKLRKFVEARVADERADARFFRAVRQNFVADDARVEIQLEHQAVRNAVFLHQILFALVRVQIHAADFIEFESPPVLPDALLRIDDRPRRSLFDLRADDQDDDSGQHAADQAADDIHQPLDQRLKRRGIIHRAGQHRIIADVLDELLLAHAALQRQLLVHDDAHLLALRNELFRRLDRVRLDEHLVHPLAADVLRRVAQIRRHRDSVQRLPLRVAIREHEPRQVKRIVCGCQQHLGYLRRARFRRDNQHGAPFLVLYPLLQQLLVDLPKRAAQDHVQRRCAVENDSRI